MSAASSNSSAVTVSSNKPEIDAETARAAIVECEKDMATIKAVLRSLGPPEDDAEAKNQLEIVWTKVRASKGRVEWGSSIAQQRTHGAAGLVVAATVFRVDDWPARCGQASSHSPAFIAY